MRRMRLLLALAIGLFVLSGCNSDEPKMVIDTDYMNGLTRGETSTCYEFDSYEAYMREATPDAKWEKQDMSEWCGWQVPGPGQLLIHDGKTWSPLVLFNISVGWHPLYYPYYAYQRKTGKDTEFYVTRPFQYDSESNTLSIEDGFSGYKKEYEVQGADEKGMTLVYVTRDFNGEPTWKWIMNYKKGSIDLSKLSNNPFYDSNEEAKLAMVKLLKEECGTPFDLNPYFKGQIEFPGPFDLDKIEQMIIDGTDWNSHENFMIYDPEDYK